MPVGNGNRSTACETCAYYVWDEDDEAYCCDMDMDEDDCVSLATGRRRGCPYYRNGDEYRVVRHQI